MEENQIIGTIISSVLHYDDFLEVNGYVRTTDTSKVKWVPCDGRSVAGSKYALSAHCSANGKSAPDLRGVFLRGINDYDVPGYSPHPKHNQLNPEDKKANEFQDDAIEKHTHVLNLYRHGYAWGNAPDGVSTNEYKQHDNSLKKMSTFENENAASETRPKNVTVYFYLKIN